MWNASIKLMLFGCVISICCVGFASLDVVCNEPMIVPGMFVCSSFLISGCMFIVSNDLLISSATVIVRAGRAIWLNPFATVFRSVCRGPMCFRYLIFNLSGPCELLFLFYFIASWT